MYCNPNYKRFILQKQSLIFILFLTKKRQSSSFSKSAICNGFSIIICGGLLCQQPTGLMFHSDRGSQYTAFAFRQLLDTLNVVQSFSKKGYPFDNACCECFFKYLKKEETNRKTYHSLQELQLSIFEYIEGFYNSKRPHGSLGMLTPNEKEELFWNQY